MIYAVYNDRAFMVIILLILLDVDLTDIMIYKIPPHMRKRALCKYDPCK